MFFYRCLCFVALLSEATAHKAGTTDNAIDVCGLSFCRQKPRHKGGTTDNAIDVCGLSFCRQKPVYVYDIFVWCVLYSVVRSLYIHI